MDIVRELHAIELPWDEVLPMFLVQWLNVFAKAHNVVKEIMLPAILIAVSGLIAPKARLRMSAIEEEPVNLFTTVLAPHGAGKSAALHATVENPIIGLEESTETPILGEDFTRSGVFNYLKSTDGLGVFAKDEVHVIISSMVGKGAGKDMDKDLLIKFFDNAQWTVNKGNSAKRERISRTGMAFFGLSQPESFFSVYEKLAKQGNGLVDRILCCCPKPVRLTRTEVNTKVRELQQYAVKSLDTVYEFIYHRHNAGEQVVHSLSEEAFAFFIAKEEELVEEQNKIILWVFI